MTEPGDVTRALEAIEDPAFTFAIFMNGIAPPKCCYQRAAAACTTCADAQALVANRKGQALEPIALAGEPTT